MPSPESLASNGSTCESPGTTAVVAAPSAAGRCDAYRRWLRETRLRLWSRADTLELVLRHLVEEARRPPVTQLTIDAALLGIAQEQALLCARERDVGEAALLFEVIRVVLG